MNRHTGKQTLSLHVQTANQDLTVNTCKQNALALPMTALGIFLNNLKKDSVFCLSLELEMQDQLSSAAPRASLEERRHAHARLQIMSRWPGPSPSRGPPAQRGHTAVTWERHVSHAAGAADRAATGGRQRAVGRARFCGPKPPPAPRDGERRGAGRVGGETYSALPVSAVLPALLRHGVEVNEVVV